MSLSAHFIHRPVSTTLLTLGIALAGALAFVKLPVSPLPQVDFPTIQIQASVPGASPETMAATVATPLEQALGQIAGVSEMSSQSSLGQTRVTLQFNLDRNIDSAATDVQGAINAARASLPTSLVRNPSYRKVNPADSPIMILSLTSDTMSQGQLYDAASTIVAQRIAQVRGVGQVNVGGSSLPAIRVQLNPAQLNHHGVSLAAVRNAISNLNANRPKGVVEDAQRRWQIGANDQARQPADYLPLIVTWHDDAPVRLADVASVTESVEDERNAGIANGKPAVLVMVNRQPNANIIDTVERIRAQLPMLQASIPRSATLDVAMDRTPTIRASLREVERTLVIAIALVVLVVFLFLRSLRAALVPGIVVPATLVGSFAAIYLAGFSLNNLSLMALTIATGFVVDDAIVVLENITRHIEAGKRPLDAALQGVREVAFTVVSVSASLIAVFIPILAMGGIVGRLLREFAVTLSIAILLSLLLSLTATPMLCARLLKVRVPRDPGRLARVGLRMQGALTRGYDRSLGWALRHGRITLLLLTATIGLNVWLYGVVPKGFFPRQDTGRLMGFINTDDNTSFQSLHRKLATFIDIVGKDPAVESVNGSVGGGSARLFVSLKPLRERRESADEVINRLRRIAGKVPGTRLILFPMQDIRIGGRQSSSDTQFTLRSDDLRALREWEPRVRAAMSRLPQLVDVDTDAAEHGLQTTLVIDRERAARLGVNTRQITALLSDAFSQRQVSTLYAPLNQYHVVMEVAPQFREGPQALQDTYVTAANGNAVPLSSFAQWGPGAAPESVSHQGLFAASTISFALAPGVSMSEATAAIRDMLGRLGVPPSVHGSFEGSAGAFQTSLASQPWLILAAIVTVYLVLGMLYESLIHPLTILSTLPSAGVGALLALLATDTDFGIIALIGVLMLIGIVMKNAILMVDFALAAERREQLSPQEAIQHACRLRLRPILMTTLAAMLGALPLALGAGDGAELRRPLGIAIVGGLALSQLLTLYTTPVVYLYLDRFRHWALRRRAAHVPLTSTAFSEAL